MRPRRATARSSDVRRRLPPGAVLALERHGVTELRVGTATAAAGPGRRRGGAGGASAGIGAGGPRQLGLLAVIAVALRGGPGRRRCSFVVARGSVGVGRGASAARVAAPLLGAAASAAAAASASASASASSPSLPAWPPARSLSSSPVSGSCGCRGAGALRTAGVAGPSEAERESSPSSADARATGIADAAARLATGLGAADTTCSRAPGGRGGGAAGWASEGCAAAGGGAAAAASPSLDDEVDDVGDGGAPAAQPPGAAPELLPEAAV